MAQLIMQDLSYLGTLDETSFEAERCRLIANELLKVAPERRKKLVILQMELDQVRDKGSPEEFMRYCMARISENLENLGDQFGLLKSSLQPPAVRPPAER